jgi:uncharacterized protein YbjT (DUF2867 family)
MTDHDLVLVTGAGGVSRLVIERLRAQDVPVRVLVRREDDRATGVRALGAEVVPGDLTRPETVAAALDGVRRAYFGLSVSPDHLLAATVVATVAKAHGELDVLVDMPVVHVRPTSFLDNPLFTTLTARSIRENGTLALPFGTGRTSPVAADDVAWVVVTTLRDPGEHAGKVYELTGPRALDMTEVAQEFSKALGRPASYVDVPLEWWRTEVLANAGLPQQSQGSQRGVGASASLLRGDPTGPGAHGMCGAWAVARALRHLR